MLSGVMDVPLSTITCGESGAESLIVTAPLIVPTVVGVKVTFTLQLAPAFRLDGQLFVWAKLPLAEMEDTITAAGDVIFHQVTTFAALVVWRRSVRANAIDNGVGVTIGMIRYVERPCRKRGAGCTGGKILEKDLKTTGCHKVSSRNRDGDGVRIHKCRSAKRAIDEDQARRGEARAIQRESEIARSSDRGRG